MAQIPMYAAMVNSPGTELAADITATDTEISVLDATKLPDAPNLVTVGGDETAETIRYTGKTGNTLTGCTRGFEGTAKGWAAGSPAARNYTAYDYEAGRANIADVSTRVDNIVIPDGTTAQKGIVQLSDATGGSRSTVAATEKAVSDARTSVDGKIGNLANLNTADKSNVVAALNEVFTHVDEGKELVKTAVIVKGGTVAGTSPHSFQQLADGIETIETATVINGQAQVSAVYAETIRANDPVYAVTSLIADNTISTYPTSAVRSTTFSPDGLYLALAVNVAPRVLIYKRSGKTFTKLADPSVTPTGVGLGASFSPDGLYLAIAHATAPYITIYKRSGDTFTKLADPAVLPTGDGYSATWSTDGVYLAVGHNTSPSLTIYRRSGDTFTKLSNPATLPTSISNGVCFSMDGVYLSVAHNVSPYITIYKRSGDTFTKLADPATLPLGGGTSISFSADSTYLALGCAVAPYIVIYKRSGDVFSKLPDLASLPTGIVNAVTFRPGTGGYLSLAHTSAPFVSNYKQQGDMFVKLANPPVLPPGNGTAISYSNDGTFLSIGAGSSNYFLMYSVIYNQVFKSNNLMSDLALAASAGYALEDGVAGETKNIILIWR